MPFLEDSADAATRRRIGSRPFWQAGNDPRAIRRLDSPPLWPSPRPQGIKGERDLVEAVRMIEVTTSIEISGPLPEVFGYVSDPFNLPSGTVTSSR